MRMACRDASVRRIRFLPHSMALEQLQEMLTGWCPSVHRRASVPPLRLAMASPQTSKGFRDDTLSEF